jgi:F-type H+-transporting ATPase subunit delta
VSKETSATRYAKAIFAIAVEKNELAGWKSDLEKMAVLGGNETVADLLENPSVHSEDKIKVLTAVIGDTSPLALNLIKLLVVKNKFDLTPEIAAHYQQLLDRYNGIERAEVVTAIPLSENERQDLETRLGKVINKRVIISRTVDPDLIGGIVARMGGKLLDGSVRNKLENLKKEISGVS